MKLNEALRRLAEIEAQLATLSAEVKEHPAPTALGAIALQPAVSKCSWEPEAGSTPQGDVKQQATDSELSPTTPQTEFMRRLIDPNQGEDERKVSLAAKPELFVQARFSSLPVAGATIADIAPNFRISRAEARWSGRLDPHFGAGLEIQYHPANDGDPTQLINDAFLQYYPSEHVTLTVGQFVLPFGFDNQQSSSVRESPERAMFVGYFFPGHRDRGLLLQGAVDDGRVGPLNRMQYFAGIFNGNRFWSDNNRQVNYDFRIRKQFDALHLAMGVSAQVGHQLLPASVSGSNHQDVFGIDVQYARNRFGFRTELIAGNMPSTLLSLHPVFAPAFQPGRHSSAGTAFATFQLSENDAVYARYDQFNGDPVTDKTDRAENVGWFHQVTTSQRIGLDYQWKNRVSFNDDAVNTRLQISWASTF